MCYCLLSCCFSTNVCLYVVVALGIYAILVEFMHNESYICPNQAEYRVDGYDVDLENMRFAVLFAGIICSSCAMWFVERFNPIYYIQSIRYSALFAALAVIYGYSLSLKNDDFDAEFRNSISDSLCDRKTVGSILLAFSGFMSFMLLIAALAVWLRDRQDTQRDGSFEQMPEEVPV